VPRNQHLHFLSSGERKKVSMGLRPAKSHESQRMTFDEQPRPGSADLQIGTDCRARRLGMTLYGAAASRLDIHHSLTVVAPFRGIL
jgi:hypothetical protein